MSSPFARKSQAQPTNGRAIVAQLNRTQQPQPSLTSGRALVGQIGVGRRYPGATSLLRPYPLALPPAPLPDFHRLQAQAQQLQAQLARYDQQAALANTVAAPARLHTPAEAGYPVPFLSPAEQARWAQQRRSPEREHFIQQKLAQVNALAQSVPLSPVVLTAMRSPFIDLRARGASTPSGPDCFMPISFWRSQNPHNDPKVGWKLCCATVKGMVGYNAGLQDRIQIVREHGHSLVRQSGAAAGFSMLDKYMALHKPVMTGVNHTYGAGYNEGTTDHFIAIVGTGTDAKGKYYRFFDVGASNAHRDNGTNPLNRLYYDARTGSYSGKSMVNNKTYTISQLRFKPGTF